jgi:hypothetical protein
VFQGFLGWQGDGGEEGEATGLRAVWNFFMDGEVGNVEVNSGASLKLNWATKPPSPRLKKCPVYWVHHRGQSHHRPYGRRSVPGV